MDHLFSTKIKKSRKNKNLSSQIFVVRNIVIDPLNVWSNNYMPFIVTRILFRIRRLSELGVYKETFIKGLNKVLSAAHLQNKSLKTMLEQTFYMKVLAEVVLWFSIKYSYIFSCFFFFERTMELFHGWLLLREIGVFFIIGVNAACILAFNRPAYLCGQSR